MNHMSQSTEADLPAIGAPFQGGFFAGTMFLQDGTKYALILAPKAEGEAPDDLRFTNGSRWETTARSLHDGQANTQALLDGDNPAAKFCAGLDIGGFRDWYLPAKDEIYLIVSHFLPADDGDNWNPPPTAIEAFRLGGNEAFRRTAYWSSTEASAYVAWVQDFYDGYQTFNFKYNDWRVRAVRKYPL